MQAQRILLGAASYVPGLNGRVVNRGTGGTNKASYCYGVWLKHLTLLNASGFQGVPERLGELGPGDSIGVGLAALLSGARAYFALDIKQFTTLERNEAVLDQLVQLFRARTARPTKGWPDFDEHLDDNLFPSHVLTEARLERSLAPERIDRIRRALRGDAFDDVAISSKAPWNRSTDVARGSVDLILSHSVMEHVADLEDAYGACATWLRPGGWMSHQIDFQSHGLARHWNGCWTYGSALYWKLLAGRRDCWINREPVSVHRDRIAAAGFEPVRELLLSRTDGIERQHLAPAWRSLSDEDFLTAGAFVQARKPG